MDLSTHMKRRLHSARTAHRALACLVALSSLCVLLLSAFSPTRASAAPPCAQGKGCPVAMSAETARGLALGTGMRATAISTSALAYNPAGLALGRLYHVEGVVDYIPGLHTVALGGAVVDSSTSRLAAGFGLRGLLSGTEGFGGFDGRLGVALPFSDAVSIGLSGRYLSLTENRKDAAGVGKLAGKVSGFTMDASLRVQPTQILQLSLGTLNFIDLGSSYAPLMVSTSAALALGQVVNIGADLLVDTSTFAKPAYLVGGGIEVLVGDSLPLRVGYIGDLQRKTHAIGGGLGYTDRFMGFDISLQQQVYGGSDTRFMGALRYYVH